MLADWLGYNYANWGIGSLPVYTFNLTIPPQSAGILLVVLMLALGWSVAGRSLRRRRRKLELLRKAYIDLLAEFPWPICAFDAQGVVAFWNRECETTSGIAAGEIVADARRTAEVFSAKKHPLNWNNSENTFVLSGCRAGHAVLWRKVAVNYGSWPLWIVGQVLGDGGSATCGVFSEQRLQALFSEMNLSVVLFDRQRQEVFRHRSGAEVASPDPFCGDGLIDEAFDTGNPVGFSREAGGRAEEVELLPLREEDGRLDYVAAVVRDVTERRLAERERRMLERHQRQDQKIEALATLAGGMAHDFNNIMATISGYAEIIGYDQEPSGRLGQYAAAISQAAASAKELVRKVLLFSRNGTVEPRAVALTPILLETLDGLRAELSQGVELELDLIAGDATVWAEPFQLHLLIRSICENAIQATAEGAVRVEAAICQGADADLPDRCVRLRVSDTGVGMDQATLVRIFEPFFTTKAMGRGLGLAMAQGIVNSLGGEISVRSQLGCGSVFTVYLPTAVQTSVGGAALEPLAGHGQSVLIFDHQIEVLDSLCAQLREWGYNVTASNDRADLLELLRPQVRPWFFVLADPGLPRDGGEELVRSLAEQCSGTPLVLMSYYVDSFDPFFLKNLGIELMLEKPLDQAKLIKAVRFAFAAHGG